MGSCNNLIEIGGELVVGQCLVHAAVTDVKGRDALSPGGELVVGQCLVHAAVTDVKGQDLLPPDGMDRHTCCIAEVMYFSVQTQRMTMNAHSPLCHKLCSQINVGTGMFCSNQWSTTGPSKTVICAVLSVGKCI